MLHSLTQCLPFTNGLKGRGERRSIHRPSFFSRSFRAFSSSSPSVALPRPVRRQPVPLLGDGRTKAQQREPQSVSDRFEGPNPFDLFRREFANTDGGADRSIRVLLGDPLCPVRLLQEPVLGHDRRWRAVEASDPRRWFFCRVVGVCVPRLDCMACRI